MLALLQLDKVVRMGAIMNEIYERMWLGHVYELEISKQWMENCWLQAATRTRMARRVYEVLSEVIEGMRAVMASVPVSVSVHLIFKT